MTLLLRMDDRMNRQLSCTVVAKDDAMALAEELVHYGFINEVLRPSRCIASCSSVPFPLTFVRFQPVVT